MLLACRLALVVSLLIGQSVALGRDPLAAAEAQFRSGKWEEAVLLYRAALKDNPKSAQAAAGLVRALLKQEQLDAALQAAQQGVAAQPASALTHAALGDVYFRQGGVEKAEREYKKAVAIDASSARGWWGLGRVLQCTSMHKRAKTAFDNAYAADASDPDIVRSWAKTRTSVADGIIGFERYLTLAQGEDPDRLMGMRANLAVLKSDIAGKNWILTSFYAPADVPLELLRPASDGPIAYAIKVSINGNQPVNLKLDTGASGGIHLNPKTAARLGVRRIADMRVAGLGGQGLADAYVGTVASVRIGQVELQNAIISVSHQEFETDSEGVIGTDIFAAFLITLDFPDQKLRLEPLPGQQRAPQPQDEPVDRTVPSKLKRFTPVYNFSNLFLVPTRVNGHPPELFSLDTGTSMNTISVKHAREVTAEVTAVSDAHVSGVAGKVKDVYAARRIVLQFSHFRQENQDIVALDMQQLSKALRTEVAGILGLPLLRMFVVTLDYRDGLVNFRYSPRP